MAGAGGERDHDRAPAGRAEFRERGVAEKGGHGFFVGGRGGRARVHDGASRPEDGWRANFGITLSLWDYIFRTNYIPSDGRDIKLGFEGMEKFPKKFFGMTFYGFKKQKN